MYKIKNIYFGKFEGGGLIVNDILADQELLKANNIDYKTTYDIKEDLKKYGFKFNPYDKKIAEWVLFDLTEKEEDEILKSLKNKYLVEKELNEITCKNKCSMCGSYYYKICDCERLMK